MNLRCLLYKIQDDTTGHKTYQYTIAVDQVPMKYKNIQISLMNEYTKQSR